ncbi:Uncharacterized HTH-type transcriptional regulator YagI [Eumeta japonica]|uniref:Uncharacterized HTH-type transcriptional regulator YagI n=1 Tax=Eumeta variegata TaxID=151549 RepID=A0A4C1T910_EUMVA|nr:Uncharacterized HTH-type transcriptional regulator YagI [Eumeta japonica]
MATQASETHSGRSDGGVRSVARALRLLDAFDSADTALTIANLARLAGLPRTTALRMVDTLAEEGMLTVGEDGNVRVGPRLIRWGALASAAWDVPAATTARMREVAEATGDRQYLHPEGTATSGDRASPEPHTLRHPCRDSLITEIALGSNGRVTREDLGGLVEEARRDGFAISHGGRSEGTTGLAVPLRVADERARIPAGLALGGPSFRFEPAVVPDFLSELRAAARDISSTGLPPALN